MKFIYYILLIISLSIQLFSQDNYIDSLYNEYNTQEDRAIKVNIKLKIAEFFIDTDPDSAQTILQTQEKDLKKVSSTPDLAKYNFLMGECLFNLNEYKAAIPFYQKSMDLYKELNDEENIADNLHKIGLCCFYTGQYQEALYNYHEEVIIAEKNDYKDRVAHAYQDIGLVYSEIKTYNKAQQYYEKALAINKEINNTEKIAALYQNIGVIHHNKENFDTALMYYQKSLDIYQQLEHKLGIASSYLNIGLIYETMNDDRAVDNYQHAKIMFEEINHARGIIYALNSLSIYTKNKGYYNEAIEYINESIELAVKYHLIETLVESYREASEEHTSLNNHKEALYYYKKYAHLNDSLYNANNVRQILELEMKYQSEKFERKLQEEKNKNKLYIAGFILIFILFIIIFITILKRN